MPVIIGDDYLDEDLSVQRDILNTKLKNYLKNLNLDDDYIYLTEQKLVKTNGDIKYDDKRVTGELERFKAVFKSNDKDLRVALWNNMNVDFELISRKYRDLINDEEYSFLKDFEDNKHNNDKYNYDFYNVNNEFESFNIKLIPANINFDKEISDPNYKLLINHLKNDGNFEDYFHRRQEKNDLNIFRFSNLSFYICLKDNTCIGLISLFADSSSNSYRFTDEETVASLSFYIFKEYRSNGYCNEAIWLLSDLVFHNRLIVPIETIRKNVFEFKPANILLLTAITDINNKSSKEVLTLSDFVKEGTIHKYAKIDDRFIDVNYYELTKELYLDIEKYRNSANELYGKEKHLS